MDVEQKAEVLSAIQRGLPSDWIARFSKKHKNRVFYFNTCTGKSTWSHPTEQKDFISGDCSSRKCTDESGNSSSELPDLIEKGSGTVKTVPNKRKTYHDDSQIKLSSKGNEKTIKTQKLQKPCNAFGKEKVGCFTSKVNSVLIVVPDIASPLKRAKTNDVNILPQQKLLGKAMESSCGNSSLTSVTEKCSFASSSSVAQLTFANGDEKYNKCRKNQKPVVSSAKLSTKIPQKRPLANTAKSDIEMEDISTFGVSMDSDTAIPRASALLYIVVDTNIFLGTDGLKEIDSLMELQLLPHGSIQRSVVVVPWIVLQELDHLKMNSSKTKQARRAVAFLNKRFSSKSPGIRGQTIIEAASIVEGLTVECNDDRILQCCFFLSHLSGNHVTILYSKDANLCNKALINHFRAFSSFNALLMDISALDRNKDFTFDIKQTALTVSAVENLGKVDDQSPENPDSNIKGESVLGQSEEDLYFSSKEFTRTVLSSILETEMKKAYGEELWEEIILKKPPWSLLDVLQCIKKHWIAVFSMAKMDRLLLVHVERLIGYLKAHNKQSVKCNDPGIGREKNTPWIELFITHSIQLIAGLMHNHQKEEHVKLYLQKLQKLLNIARSMKTALNTPNECDVTTQKISAEEFSIVAEDEFMIYEDSGEVEDQDVLNQNYQIFWNILDQIWISIIEHTAMIFRSLNFVATQINDSVLSELKQELSTPVSATVPSLELSLCVIPLLMVLINSFLEAISRFLSANENETPAPLHQCLDFLQTLWTITQAFKLDTKLPRIKPITVQHSCKAHEDRSKLLNGYEKLTAVAGVLKECANYVQ